MADIDKLNIDSIIQRLLEGKTEYVSVECFIRFVRLGKVLEMVGTRLG